MEHGMHWKAVWRWDNPTILAGRKQMLVCSAAWKVHASRGAVPDDFGDSLVFGEIHFPLWGFGWEFCDLLSQLGTWRCTSPYRKAVASWVWFCSPAKAQCHNWRCQQLAVKRWWSGWKPTKKKTTPPGWWVRGVSKLLVVKYIVSIIFTQLVVYTGRNWYLIQRRIIELHHLPTF